MRSLLTYSVTCLTDMKVSSPYSPSSLPKPLFCAAAGRGSGPPPAACRARSDLQSLAAARDKAGRLQPEARLCACAGVRCTKAHLRALQTEQAGLGTP